VNFNALFHSSSQNLYFQIGRGFACKSGSRFESYWVIFESNPGPTNRMSKVSIDGGIFPIDTF
jgi:hypothetical protein